MKISQNLQENTCARVFVLIKIQVWGVIKKWTLAQVFHCELCEISKNTFFTEHLRTTTSDHMIIIREYLLQIIFVYVILILQKILQIVLYIWKTFYLMNSMKVYHK